MLVVIIAITIDSQIGYVADFIPERLSSNSGVFTFIVITVMFAITQYHILAYIRKSNKEIHKISSSKLHKGVSVAQYLLAVVIAVAILLILLAQQYNIVSLYIVSCH